MLTSEEFANCIQKIAENAHSDGILKKEYLDEITIILKIASEKNISDANIKRLEKAFQALQAAEISHPIKNWLLGFCFKFGLRASQDKEFAAELAKAALLSAAEQGQVKAADCLLKLDSIRDDLDTMLTSFVSAVEEGHIEIVRRFSQENIPQENIMNIPSDSTKPLGCTLLHTAIGNGQLRMVECLLKNFPAIMNTLALDENTSLFNSIIYYAFFPWQFNPVDFSDKAPPNMKAKRTGDSINIDMSKSNNQHLYCYVYPSNLMKPFEGKLTLETPFEKINLHVVLNDNHKAIQQGKFSSLGQKILKAATLSMANAQKDLDIPFGEHQLNTAYVIMKAKEAKIQKKYSEEEIFVGLPKTTVITKYKQIKRRTNEIHQFFNTLLPDVRDIILEYTTDLPFPIVLGEEPTFNNQFKALAKLDKIDRESTRLMFQASLPARKKAAPYLQAIKTAYANIKKLTATGTSAKPKSSTKTKSPLSSAKKDFKVIRENLEAADEAYNQLKKTLSFALEREKKEAAEKRAAKRKKAPRKEKAPMPEMPKKKKIVGEQRNSSDRKVAVEDACLVFGHVPTLPAAISVTFNSYYYGCSIGLPRFGVLPESLVGLPGQYAAFQAPVFPAAYTPSSSSSSSLSLSPVSPSSDPRVSIQHSVPATQPLIFSQLRMPSQGLPLVNPFQQFVTLEARAEAQIPPGLTSEGLASLWLQIQTQRNRLENLSQPQPLPSFSPSLLLQGPSAQPRHNRPHQVPQQSQIAAPSFPDLPLSESDGRIDLGQEGEIESLLPQEIEAELTAQEGAMEIENKLRWRV